MQFVNVTSRAWSLHILAHLHMGVAGRQASLLAATGANRTAFAHSMEHLIAIGLLERTPGHGHPLRPEFRLTPAGTKASELACKIHSVADAKNNVLIRRAWTLPILTALHQPSHFNQIKRDLYSITDRALSQSLKAMEGQDWVSRSVDQASRPPRSIYRSVNTGGQISDLIASEITFARPANGRWY